VKERLTITTFVKMAYLFVIKDIFYPLNEIIGLRIFYE